MENVCNIITEWTKTWNLVYDIVNLYLNILSQDPAWNNNYFLSIITNLKMVSIKRIIAHLFSLYRPLMMILVSKPIFFGGTLRSYDCYVTWSRIVPTAEWVRDIQASWVCSRQFRAVGYCNHEQVIMTYHKQVNELCTVIREAGNPFLHDFPDLVTINSCDCVSKNVVT